MTCFRGLDSLAKPTSTLCFFNLSSPWVSTRPYRLLSSSTTCSAPQFPSCEHCLPSASQFFGTSLPAHLHSAPSLLAPASMLLPLVTSITASQFRPATFLAQISHPSAPHKICQLTTLLGIESKVSHMLSKYLAMSNTPSPKTFLLFVVLWTPG